MNRMKLLFAALAVAATAAAVPAANAQVVHYIGAGSSAMFQGFAVAAYNDLALGADGSGVCVGGVITIVSPGAPAGTTLGDACTTHHWSVKTAGALAGVKDGRSASIPEEFGNFWAVYVTDTATGADTDVWAYLSVDSTVGVRTFLATPRAKLLLSTASETTTGANVIAAALFSDGLPDSAGLPSDVYTALSGALGQPITAGMTDIRPEDAKLATERILGSVPAPFGGDTVPTTANNFIYSFSLNYGPGPVGTGIKSGEPSSTAVASPVEFALPGGTDPITSSTVSSTINVYPVGESPIIFVANRTNKTTGLGQVIPSQAACGGTPTPDCLSVAYTSDGSYQYRNVWDQHPWPAVANTFPNLNFPTTGYCSVAANQSKAACHGTRRPLGNLFSGGDCETDSSAFTWPLDKNTEGFRVLPPNGTAEPITLFLREPLSGTYNTTEYTEMRRYGTPGGSLDTNGAGVYERAPYISQETNVVIGQPNMNPLNLQCPAKFGGEGSSTEGSRLRGIGTGEVLNGATGTVAGEGVLNTPDSLAYAFFSFGNVSKLAASQNYGYLMIDGVDPLFTAYNGSGGEPGQPVNWATTTSPLNWGVLPACGGTSTFGTEPACTAAAIWGSVPSFPHLRDGSYPAWSELRMLCDPSDPQLTVSRCTLTNDPLGAEALVENLEADIHFSHTGGVPDLLPFSDASSGALSFGGSGAAQPYGDAAFVRQHYNLYGPDDQDFAKGTCEWVNTVPSSTHLGGSSALTATCTQTFIDFSTEACSTGHTSPGTPANGPAPVNECGGDAGGFIVAVSGGTGGAATGNLQ